MLVFVTAFFLKQEVKTNLNQSFAELLDLQHLSKVDYRRLVFMIFVHDVVIGRCACVN